MQLKTFLFGLTLTFGMAWVFLFVIPTATILKREPLRRPIKEGEHQRYYQREIAGSLRRGAEIYAAQGCYTCHSQLIRPTYLGKELWRKGMAGRLTMLGDRRRKTAPTDYDGEHYASLGMTRIGPDLSNVGHRVDAWSKVVGKTPLQWILARFYNPENPSLYVGEDRPRKTLCPHLPFLFEKKVISGQVNCFSVRVERSQGARAYQFLPKDDAFSLASYLLSLRRDDSIAPSSNP